MSNIYKDAQGRDVYDNGGQTIDAHTGQPVGTASLPSLPSGGGAVPGSTPSLPPGTSTPGGLTSFSDALDATVNLIRQHRNAASFDIASPYMGSVGSGSFGTIVEALNKSSNKRISDQLKKSTPDIVTATDDNGNVSGINKVTGKVLWTAKGVGNKQTGTALTAKDEANDIADAILHFRKQMLPVEEGGKGWAGANPQAYEYYRNEIQRLYGAAAVLKLEKAMEDAHIIVDTGE